LANGLKVIHALTASDTLQNLGLFVVTIWRNKSHDRPANHFVGGIAEYSRSSIVPTGDDTVDVLAHDRVT